MKRNRIIVFIISFIALGFVYLSVLPSLAKTYAVCGMLESRTYSVDTVPFSFRQGDYACTGNNMFTVYYIPWDNNCGIQYTTYTLPGNYCYWYTLY